MFIYFAHLNILYYFILCLEIKIYEIMNYHITVLLYAIFKILMTYQNDTCEMCLSLKV